MSETKAEEQVPRDEVFLSDLAKLWELTRDTIESFSNQYLSAAAEERTMSGPDWVRTNLELAGRMWLHGLSGTDIVIRRTLDLMKPREAGGPD